MNVEEVSISDSKNIISEMPDLIGMLPDELEKFVADLGKEKYRAAQIMKWVHQGLALSFDDMTNLSKEFRRQLSERSRISDPLLITETRAKDGTTKFLFGLFDRKEIETVYIPGEDHDTLCVSSQVGCAMGCRICRTSSMGFLRNLRAGEIVGQLLAVRRLRPQAKITNIVFMGMGEPTANIDEVIKAVQILTNPNGPKISWRHITVSTAGLVPQIKELGKRSKVKLAVSLNAVSDQQRDKIMPVNKKYPIAELMQALREYPLPRGMRITIEYVMIRDFNDSDHDARELVRLLNPIKAKVNLIPFNDHGCAEFKTPSPDRVARFQEILMSKSLTTIIRKSRGTDILAACGQLASRSR